MVLQGKDLLSLLGLAEAQLLRLEAQLLSILDSSIGGLQLLPDSVEFRLELEGLARAEDHVLHQLGLNLWPLVYALSQRR